MSKIINIIIESVFFLFFIFSFSNGIVYFIKNINKDESIFLNILLVTLILSVFAIIEQYKLLKKLYKDYTNEK